MPFFHDLEIGLKGTLLLFVAKMSIIFSKLVAQKNQGSSGFMMRLAFLPLGIQCVEIDAPRLDFIAFKENEMQRDWQRQAWKSWSSLNTYALI